MNKVHQWHQLSRYYLNKWKYDGTKWAERIWYGTGATKNVVSVPFMITRNMRIDLEKAGFPPSQIATLVPQTAHQLLINRVTYHQYREMQKQSKQNVDEQKTVKTNTSIVESKLQ